MISDVLQTTIDLDLGGKVFTFAPLTYKDWAALEKWVRFYDYYAIRDVDGNTDAAKHVLDKCLGKAVSMAELDRYLALPSGQIELIYLSVRRNHPEATKDELAELVTFGELENVVEVIQRLSLPTPEEGSGSGSAKKKQRRKSN